LFGLLNIYPNLVKQILLSHVSQLNIEMKEKIEELTQKYKPANKLNFPRILNNEIEKFPTFGMIAKNYHICYLIFFKRKGATISFFKTLLKAYLSNILKENKVKRYGYVNNYYYTAFLLQMFGGSIKICFYVKYIRNVNSIFYKSSKPKKELDS
ncbi:hypothetical protein ACJX0J_012788, partial [Zea mays]